MQIRLTEAIKHKFSNSGLKSRSEFMKVASKALHSRSVTVKRLFRDTYRTNGLPKKGKST